MAGPGNIIHRSPGLVVPINGSTQSTGSRLVFGAGAAYSCRHTEIKTHKKTVTFFMFPPNILISTKDRPTIYTRILGARRFFSGFGAGDWVLEAGRWVLGVRGSGAGVGL
jgi:hypothetical protein